MKDMKLREEELIPLGDMLADITGTPRNRVAGFVCMIAVYEENDSPGGRLIASTPSLRTVQSMIEIAGSEVQAELDKLAGLS